MSNYREWSMRDEFNPFNTLKILRHADYWSNINIEDGKIFVPPPIAVTIDPANICNYSCIGCNAQKVIAENKTVMSEKWMNELPQFLNDWGVRSVTLAGGGEPLMSPYMNDFFAKSSDSKYELALITNGYFIDKFLMPIGLLTKWVGVSVDAGTAETYAYIKNTDVASFNVVLKNIKKLTSIHPRVTYKFLINKQNIEEIYTAVMIAKDLGCSAIHIRPIGLTWYETDKKQIFSGEQVDKALAAISEARQAFEDNSFKVYGVTHKFDKNWQLANCFEKCWATFMYLVMEPNGVVSTCCDNRGNPAMQLAKGLGSPWEILKYWGSEAHVKMFNEIDVKKCPRCTFTLHNSAYENCILKDKMDVNFI